MEPRANRETRHPAVALLPVVLLLLAVLGLAVAGRRAAGILPAFASCIESLGAWGAVAFVLGYLLGTIAFVPGSLLTLAAGAIFGIPKGIPLVLVGATLGASAAFLIARYLARGPVERWLRRDERLAAVDRAIGAHGRRIVLLLRLSPIFPFNLLNYALGLTRVRFGDYLVASIGMLPATAVYVYWGKIIGDVARLAAGASVPRGPAYYLLLGLGLAATIAVTMFVTRTARGALREITGAEGVAG